MTYKFTKPARPVSRVFIHCSASDNPDHDSVAVMDAWHKQNGWSGCGYHFFIRKNGTLEPGRSLDKVPAAQEDHNIGTIAICLHGVSIDKFTAAQLSTLQALCADIDHAYQGGVTFHGHREVARKDCPVFDYKAVLQLSGTGRLGTIPSTAHVIQDAPVDGWELEVLPAKAALIRIGHQGDIVHALQSKLAELGYFVGALDGDFGTRTRAAVLAFQADNHLVTDGVVGTLTREALSTAEPRVVAPTRAMATLSDLAAGGSRIAAASIGNGIAGLALSGGGAIAVLDQLTGVISTVTGQADVVERLFAEHGLLSGIVILAAGAFVAWQARRSGQARLGDHRSGKTL